MVELIRAWKVGPRYFLDETKAWAYAKDLATKYSPNRLDAFDPKPSYLLRAELNGKVGYSLIRNLSDVEKVIE